MLQSRLSVRVPAVSDTAALSFGGAARTDDADTANTKMSGSANKIFLIVMKTA